MRCAVGLRSVLNGPPLCERCQRRLDTGESDWPSFTSIPLPLEDRFEELFKAARVLLRQGVSDVNQIIATLAFAHELGRGFLHLSAEKRQMKHFANHPELWEKAASRFSRDYGSRPIKVVDGVLIMERLPVSIHVHYHPDTSVAEKVLIRVFPHQRSIEPEKVAARYKETLLDAGIAHDGIDEVRIHSTFKQGFLLIRVGHGDRLFGSNQFPHPQLVQKSYGTLLHGPSRDNFARYLATPARGPDPFPENLIPACVAYFLARVYRRSAKQQRNEVVQRGEEVKPRSDKVNRQEIHRLLNKHVLGETWKALPEGGYASSETNQLWRDVERVGHRNLIRVRHDSSSRPSGHMT